MVLLHYDTCFFSQKMVNDATSLAWRKTCDTENSSLGEQKKKRIMKQKAITLKSLYGAFILDYILFNYPLNQITCVMYSLSSILVQWGLPGLPVEFCAGSPHVLWLYWLCIFTEQSHHTVCVHFCHADDKVAHQPPSTEAAARDAFFLMECCFVFLI